MKIKQEQRFWSLVLFLPLAVAILWGLLAVSCVVLGFSAEWEETFENLDIGTINGQGNWTSGDPGAFLVSNLNPYEGSKHLKVWNEVAGYKNAVFTADTETTAGIVEWSFKVQMKRWAETSIGQFTFRDTTPINIFSFHFRETDADTFIIKETNDLFPGKELYLDDSWATIKITLDLDTRWVYLDVNYKGEDWSQFSRSSPDMVDVKSVRIDCFDCGFDLDNMEYSFPPLVEKVWGIDPASETEITDLETTFEFGWEDLDDWDSLLIAFENRPTGIFSQAKIYEIETIGVAGTKELSFTDFNFDRNGKFYFYAVASKLEMEILEGMYLTGGYSYDWTDDLVDPEHWFTINIVGLTPIFEMTDFETWYGEVSKFATSTAMFVSIAGFFDPIFSYIGEFGNRIKDYFNLNEAYEQGYQIGKTIPYFTFFVAQVSLFLGGFPILKWVFVVILLLVGIFIFRLILKFIPGLG